MDARTVKRLLKDLNAALDDWDPLGTGVPGEYDGHAPAILGVLLRGGDEAALVEHLTRLLEEHMGIGSEAAPAGARAILSWYARATEGAE